MLAILEAQWHNVTFDEAGVNQFISTVSPIVIGAQNMTMRLADAYIAQVIGDMTDKPVNPKGITFAGDLRGVPTAEVYRRPFVEVFTGLKNGQLFSEANEVGLNRLREIADDDLNLAYRVGTQKAMKTQRVTKYRRVIRPEMSTTGSCDLCQLAAENTYNTESLLPIHTHCRCAVMPIIHDLDPGASLNAEDLGSSTAEVPVIRHHGELGPILQVAGQHFTTEAQAA